ncbi:E3 ubiquitin-protein ligase rnf213-beta [Scleropages formosus]|uniref:E3 ubiquitin-protein ligase rnf213-beta n=1 Tax=Scleropages formosus TaxID=113540 RepID=UPI0010FAB623|nr:E3 ubiquitin-protein ligase rnf213-beta-like [Scleropages formosus]
MASRKQRKRASAEPHSHLPKVPHMESGGHSSMEPALTGDPLPESLGPAQCSQNIGNTRGNSLTNADNNGNVPREGTATMMVGVLTDRSRANGKETLQEQHKSASSVGSEKKREKKKRNRKRKKGQEETKNVDDSKTQTPPASTLKEGEKDQMKKKTSQIRSTKGKHAGKAQAGPHTRRLTSRATQTEIKPDQVEPQAQRVESKHKETQTPLAELTSQHTQTDMTSTTEPSAEQPAPATETGGQSLEQRSQEVKPGQAGEDLRHGKAKRGPSDQNAENPKDVNQGVQGQTDAQKGRDAVNIQGAKARSRSTERERRAEEHQDQTGDQGRKADTRRNGASSLAREPAGPPMFTFYIYAVLDKKFRFNQNSDQLLLLLSESYYVFQTTYFLDLSEKGCLIEAHMSVEENLILRGHRLEYKYGVQQRKNQIQEVALRWLEIPRHPEQKEMHIFEGHINRGNSWNVLHWISHWVKSGKQEVPQAWVSSAQILLDQLFEKWPAKIDQEGIQQFVQHLRSFCWNFHSAPDRLIYPDKSRPPSVNVFRLVSERFLRLIRGESKAPPLKSHCEKNPVLLGLAVFQTCMACSLDVGVKGWAELCRMMTSETALDSRHIADVKSVFTRGQFTIIGLMNQCVKSLVAELPLLLLLLRKFQEPGLDATAPSSGTEGQPWEALERVEYTSFRENIRSLTDKRRMMLTLIQDHKSHAEEWPQLWIHWFCFVATEDIPEFSTQAGLDVKFLTQTLMCRLKDYERSSNSDEIRRMNLQAVQDVISHILKRLHSDHESIVHSGRVDSMLQCCINIAKSTCMIAKLVSMYKAVVLSYQLVLKVTEFQHSLLAEQASEEEDKDRERLFDMLRAAQSDLSQWRGDLLSKPLLTKSGALSYPKEFELWDALLNVECSVQQVSDQWSSAMERDLRRRISQASAVDRVLVCCRMSSVGASSTTHVTITTCLQELCQSAIRSICQDAKEGDLMEKLSTHGKAVPIPVLSAIVVESAVRFENDVVGQLLDPQSAIHHFLSEGVWQDVQVDQKAAQVLESARANLGSLVEALRLGSVPLGQLQATVKHCEEFKKLYLRYKSKKSGGQNVVIDVEKLLTQRQRDMEAFSHQRDHMDTLIKMIRKITDFITVPELCALERQHRADLQSVSLNTLVSVQSYSSGHEKPQRCLLWYDADQTVLSMAKEMHEVQSSTLMLSLWVERASNMCSPGSMTIRMTLAQVQLAIWAPQLAQYHQLARKLAFGTVTFEELDRVLQGAGDRGEGAQIGKELDLMTRILQGQPGIELNWTEHRICQIRQYQQLRQAAESASTILGIAQQLQLRGDFMCIRSLTKMREDSFKGNTLCSLSDDLIEAQSQLSRVNQDCTACLQEFLRSKTLISWVKAELKKMSEMKVFVDLASISAGENDSEIDRVACFHDAVMGYGPLIYSLPATAGFAEFMKCTELVWDALERDKKLPQKLRDSMRWLDWLKGLRETHGSVEQSSFSLATSINSKGVYEVGWPETLQEKRTMQNLLMVKVREDSSDKRYSLAELLELQNKLMLMSSKGDHGKEQVNRFMQVFDGVQRLGHVLLQLQSSGNMLFRHWEAHVFCSPKSMPCIKVRFPLPGKAFEYRGELTEQLQELCRSMEFCHQDWVKIVGNARIQFHSLNHYTAEQIVHLCHWVFAVWRRQTSIPQSVWYLLCSLKPGCTLNNVRNACSMAIETPRRPQPQQTPLVPAVAAMERSAKISEFLSGGHGENRDRSEAVPVKSVSGLSKQDDTMEDTPSAVTVIQNAADSVENLWSCFKEDMPQYLGQNLDIFTLGRFLTHLSEMNREQVKRTMPKILCEGRPNLVFCPVTDVLSTALGFYMESPEQPLPSSDEILLCQEETTAEQVELFLRRALRQSAPGSESKIFTVINVGLLTYDVSVSMGECYEHLERSAGPHYRLIIVCPLNHQHRYVPSFFSNHKVQASMSITREKAREYLRHHFIATSLHPHVFPGNLSVWIVSSTRPAVGKSLYVKRLFERFQKAIPMARQLCIRLLEARVHLDSFMRTMEEQMQSLREQDPVLLHIDVAAVQFGLEEFLFQLLILSCLSDSEGNLWRRNTVHLITIEVLRPQPTQLPQTLNKQQTVLGFLDILPTIHCRPPKEVKELAIKIQNKICQKTLDPLMDVQEFASEGIQRPYQYLKRYNRNENLDPFTYQDGSIEGNPIDCLHHFLANCGVRDPSWAELKNFSWFLNVQLKDSEYSLFCDPNFLADHLRGFKGFIIKFMILMARDFATPSINMSDQSPSLLPEDSNEDDFLACLTMRKKWESKPHPYIFFNADHISMSFLGFHVKKCPLGRINAVDPQNGAVIMGDVMSQDLLEGLQRQRISLTEDFDHLPREEKIQRISFVVGAKKGWIKGQFDPDPTYELTTDNVMKMLAIHMRLRCGIPVIIMGETGCGKTRLVRFLCDLQREGRNTENMILVKVHGGTTSDTIHRKVLEAEKLAEKNQKDFSLETILFFDEANTTESIFAIKEVLCDRCVKGHPLKVDSGLKIIAACNPYRRHSPEMVERLEHAGLGYRVNAGETEDRLGKVPLRQLVYRVQPLPPSMIPLVWDFGQLSNSAELSYIKQIVQRNVQDHSLPTQCYNVISNVLAESQRYMRSRKDECSFVSLRDVERSMRVLLWFYTHSSQLFPNLGNTTIKTLKCLALAVGVCYYPSLVSKTSYLKAISQWFPKPLNSAESIEEQISSCQDILLQNVQTRETIAKNIALKENVFLMVVCIELRIPLFLVGKPGSSKSLAKTVVADAMQGQASHCLLFRDLKEVHMVSFQCSPHSSPEGIISTFRQCARFQQDKNPDEYVSVVVLDEIGLAEDSPQMPLKTLHPLLEDGCIDNDRPDPHMKVGFVGISNWALDPAKMNRGIFVSRGDPSENELVETAKGICSSDKSVLLKIQHMFSQLSKAFLNICGTTDKNQFFGLRDYYSLVKMIFAIVKESQQEPTDCQLAEAVLRNFSGQPEDFDPLNYFQDLFQNLSEIPHPSTLQMVEKNLDRCSREESRYLLLLTTNSAALHILQQQVFARGRHPSPEIVFGSGFPKDQEYANICRNVNRVKTCMETGRTVILLNMQNLYESLYDALNQYYVYLGGQQYVDLGLGTHRVKCRVHPEFRLVVVEDQVKVYTQFPVPLINRLEKHRLDRSADLTAQQRAVLLKLKEWVQEFISLSDEAAEFELSDAFVGFHDDACASALLQTLEERSHQMKKVERRQPKKGKEEKLTDDTLVDMESREEVVQREEGEHESNNLHSNVVRMETAAADLLSSAGSEDERSLPVAEGSCDVSMDDENNESITVDEEQEYGIPESHVDAADGSDSMTDTETEEGSQSLERNEEEEIFEAAKVVLLNCATPDAVLRLKYSNLGLQEREHLRRIYFGDQRHLSLKHFLRSSISETENTNKFTEITTYSSLLTQLDIQSLGMNSCQLLLLSLHQFDTEASFCSKIRLFLRDGSQCHHILLIQMDVEESVCSNELIASAKYCTMNELHSVEPHGFSCHVVFITKLSRMAHGSQYTGFQGGVWSSVHIDDLRDREDMTANISAFCGTPFSKLLVPTTSSAEELGGPVGDAVKHMESGPCLHGLSLLRSCIQQAVGFLQDPEPLAIRSTKRVEIMLALLGEPRGKSWKILEESWVPGRFTELLLRRLAVVLAQREEMMFAPGDWVNSEARKRQALQEGGTLRNTLWRSLQTTLTPLFAQFVELLDRDANLDLLCYTETSSGLVHLWLDILEDQQTLELAVPLNSSMAVQEIPVRHQLTLGEVQQPCAAPFSWLIAEHCQRLWEESEYLPVALEDSGQRVLQFTGAFAGSRLGTYLGRLSETEAVDFGHRYLRDFVLLSFRIGSEEHLEVFTRAVQACIAELQERTAVTPELSPAWILAAARLYAPRLDTLSHLLHLWPRLGWSVLQKDCNSDAAVMREDLLALGICVEETVQQTKTSLHEYGPLLRKVELLKPCVEGAFSENYSALCSPGCLLQLEEIRIVWHGMLVVAVFLQQVVQNIDEPRLKAVALRSCALLQKVMQDSDLRKRSTLEQVIRILNLCYEESARLHFKYGTKCSVCLAEVTEPALLPCGHVFCVCCLQLSFKGGRRSCPECRATVPPDFRPAVCEQLRSALRQHQELTRRCNSFFLEVVSRFSLAEGERPEEDVVELLFSLLIIMQGSEYRTRELSPFPECVDQSPVVRSVLPKLLLQHSFEQVKGHLQHYLRNLEEHVLDREDQRELYLLFVNCFQDSLYSPKEGEALEVQRDRLQKDTSFLGRMARGQTASHRDRPAEFLLDLARLRVCLGAAARLLWQAVTLQEAVDEMKELEQRFLGQVRAVCEYGANDWHRVYLLRAINQLEGMDCVHALMKSTQWEWVFPAEIIRLQRLIPAEVDRYLCYGQPYLVLRDSVAQALMEGQADVLRDKLKELDCPPTVARVLLSLALFRQVTCRMEAAESAFRPSAQGIAVLEDFLKNSTSGEHRSLCSALLVNRVPGPQCPLFIKPGMPAHRRSLLEVLVHAAAVLQSGVLLLAPLYQIASRPQAMTESFLPTMPDDHAAEAQQWLRENRLQGYYCGNGHLCFVGECGRPVQTSTCLDCGVLIGGQNHNPVTGFTKRESVEDRTRTGHVLGEASRRADVPERNIPLAAFCTLRLLTHLAMMLGAMRDHEAVSAMIQPKVKDVLEFLWRHLEKDMEILGRSLGQNMDNTAIAVHFILQASLQLTAASGQQGADLSSRKRREQWEKLVCDSIINPVFQGLDHKLREVQEQISGDKELSGSSLMRLLYADPDPVLQLPSDCPTHHSSFWSIPVTLTVERFSQILDQNQEQAPMLLLSLFVKRAKCVKQLRHLPDLVALQSDLLRMLPLVVERSSSQTIGQLLQQIPAGQQKKMLQARVQIFIEVWNKLRMELARSEEMAVPKALCEIELRTDGPSEFLSLSRRGPASCLGTLLDFLSETHNSLVRQSRKQHLQEDSDYSIPLDSISKAQLVLCHPERELLPLLLAHRHYTLRKGKETASSFNLQGIQGELVRRFIAGKPLIRAEMSKYVLRHQQDFSELLAEVRNKIPQEPLKGSVSGAMRTVLCSFPDVCDAVCALEVALRFLGKAGGDAHVQLLSYLRDTLRMEQHISEAVAKALGECNLGESASTWQMLTCWKSELRLRNGQEPFEHLPAEYRKRLSEEERRELKAFLGATDRDAFCQELHEILLLKTSNALRDHNYPGHWDIRSTLEHHLEKKGCPVLPGLDDLSVELTLDKGPEIWKLAARFQQ